MSCLDYIHTENTAQKVIQFENIPVFYPITCGFVVIRWTENMK